MFLEKYSVKKRQPNGLPPVLHHFPFNFNFFSYAGLIGDLSCSCRGFSVIFGHTTATKAISVNNKSK